jgi:GSH-dependent disulfide-bond oxidoreductase
VLEETGLPYRILPVNINTGEQLRSEFLAVSPNNKIPAIVDRDNGLALFESGAVVQYLAGKTGKLLLSDVPGRYRALQWPWHVAASGPWPDRVPYAIERYRSETARLYEVPGTQLTKGEHVAGDYPIAEGAGVALNRAPRAPGAEVRRLPARAALVRRRRRAAGRAARRAVTAEGA